MSPEFGMPPELELPLAENVFFVKSRVLAKLLNVPTGKLHSWEKSTDILKRSRKPGQVLYTRGSALELIRYYRMSVESGEPLPKVWRRENGLPLRRTSAKPKPKPETGAVPLGSTGALSTRKISEIAGVSRSTARRYRRRNVNVSLADQREESLRGFEAAIQSVPEVMECYLMSGEVDYMLRVVVAGTSDFERIHNQLTRLPGVARVQSSFALRPILKRTSLPLR